MVITRKKAQAQARATKRLKLRKQLWPNVNNKMIWSREREDGFTTIPRTMRYILELMDGMSKGEPVSSTYLTLWCYDWYSDGFVTINNPVEVALESGFRGQRALHTWKKRMKKLVELGFINIQPGKSGDISNVLLYNPHLVIKQHHEKGNIHEMDIYNAFIERAVYVGATLEFDEEISENGK